MEVIPQRQTTPVLEPRNLCSVEGWGGLQKGPVKPCLLVTIVVLTWWPESCRDIAVDFLNVEVRLIVLSLHWLLINLLFVQDEVVPSVAAAVLQGSAPAKVKLDGGDSTCTKNRPPVRSCSDPRIPTSLWLKDLKTLLFCTMRLGRLWCGWGIIFLVFLT